MNIKWLDSKNIFIFGLGKSGISTIDFLLKTKVNHLYVWNDTVPPIEQLREEYKDEKRITFKTFNDVDWSKIDFRITSYNVCYTKLLRSISDGRIEKSAAL